MIAFFRGRHFKGHNLCPLRIHSRHDMLDGAVFSRSVQRLKDDQQSVRVLGVKCVLKLCQPANVLFQSDCRLITTLVLSSIGRMVILESDLLTGPYDKGVVFHEFLPAIVVYWNLSSENSSAKHDQQKHK